MPLTPRLASTRSPARGRDHHSTSRTGIDEEATIVEPAAADAINDRAMAGSVNPSSAARTSSIASCAARSASAHWARPRAHGDVRRRHPKGVQNTRRQLSWSATTTSPGGRSGAAHMPQGSTST